MRFDDDDDSPFSGGASFHKVMEIAQMALHWKNDNARLVSENSLLKQKLSEAKDDVRLVKSDRQTLLEQFEALKNRFNSTETLEGKYVKCITAMFAIAQGISNDEAKVVADNILKELGEKK